VRPILFRVRVVGPSMEPALQNGATVWGRKGGIAPGRIAVFTEPGRPHLVTIKRIAEMSEEGVWVVGDNPDQSRDSRHYGWVPRAFVLGTLLRIR